MKNNKKAFTIVELVIVIAVIAILAAVLIPTFSNLIQKSKVSADQQLIRNLNTALTTDAAVNGKHVNMQSALDAAFESGYDVGKINATATNNEILWDSKNDVFCYLDGNEIKYIPVPADKLEASDVDYWVIKTVKNDSDLHDKYSTYLKPDSTATTLTTTKGIDVGKCGTVTAITYDRSTATSGQSVIIRTNEEGTSLTVNAPKDTIKHYGYAGLVDVVSVAKTSYHENGTVVLVKIGNGRVVVTEDSKIGGIHAVATNDLFNDIAIAVVGNAVIPSITRDTVSEDSKTQEGTYSKFVLEVQNITSEDAQDSNPEYVWINVVVDGAGNSTITTDVATSNTVLDNSTKLDESSKSSIAASIAEEAKATLKMYLVDSQATLEAALSAPEDKVFISVVGDFTTNNIALFSKSTMIFGLGHEIKGSANRVFRVTNPNLDIEIYGLTITSICTATQDVRGISFDGVSAGSSLLLDGCSISASFYTINATPGADDLTIIVRNGTVAAGWAAINMYSNNSTVTVENSTLRGLNDKGESSWNNFNTITIDGSCLSRGKEYVGTNGSHNTITISKSTIFASSNSDNKQYWVGIQYGAIDNKVIVDEETKIVNDSGEDKSNILNIGYYCNYDKPNKKWDYYDNNSTITIGDETVHLKVVFDGDGNYQSVEYETD